jgi:hypothetical protein
MRITDYCKQSLFFQFGHCPAGCRDGSRIAGPTSRVYRSSWRALTLQCTRCGLQWTMTVHQLAKASARLLTLEGHAHLQQPWADAWAEWARDVGDKRGRKRKAEPTNPEAPAGPEHGEI